MLNYEDCIALAKVKDAEIGAPAADERYPAVIAAELSSYLVVIPTGQLYLDESFKSDLADAEAWGDRRRTARLRQVLQQFIAMHPTAAPSG